MLKINFDHFQVQSCKACMVLREMLQSDCLQGLVLVNLNLRGSSDKNPQTQAVGNSDETSLN